MKNSSVSLLSLVFCAVISSSAPRCYADNSRWVEVKSPHFSVMTDAGDNRGRDVAMRFEQMRSVFGALMTKTKVNLSVPLQIVAFRNSKEFRDFVPLWHGKPAHVAGLFQPGQDRCFIMLDLSVENPWQVVFHEYAHQLMNANVNVPLEPWFEEGFAEYFSTIEVDNKEARVGKPSENAYRVLQEMGRMKIGDLFRVQHNSQTYNEGDRQTTFYAESSMVVHYLYDNKLIPQTNQYFSLRRKSVSVEDAVQQAFGMTPAQFDKTLDSYIRSGRFSFYPIPTPSDIVRTGYAATPVNMADSAAVLADIHLHSPDYHDKAIEEFQAILKTEPDNAAALRGLGYAYLQKGQYDNAAGYFHRAAELDSNDPRVHYYSAMLLSREGSFTDRAHLSEMIKDLERAIALDPSFADPYMLLGFAQFYSSDKAKGLESMQKAVALSPRNEMYQYNLGQMYMANQQLEQALTLLHGLQATQNPELAARVQRSIAQAEQINSMLQQRPARVASELPAASSRDEKSLPRDVVRPEAPSAAFASSASVGDSRPIQYVQGIITGVDCSTPPSAVMTLVTGAGKTMKTWKMKIVDTSKLLLRNGDTFSCTWTQQKAGVNYRASSDAEGDTVWIGLQ
jgi:tetratricopeptide (TPR) repeat protein